MSNTKLPLKITVVPVKHNYSLSVSFCDGQSAQTLFKPSAAQKWIPAPYYGLSKTYKKRKAVSTGFYQKAPDLWDSWNVETTTNDFINNPPAFTWVEHKAGAKPLTPNFKSDYDTIKYLLKELKLVSVTIKDGAAHFTHTRGSFSFGVKEFANDGSLTLSEVNEIEILYC